MLIFEIQLLLLSGLGEDLSSCYSQNMDLLVSSFAFAVVSLLGLLMVDSFFILYF